MYYNLNDIYRNYGSRIVEQAATLSADADARLKQYLEDDELIEYIAGELAGLEAGADVELEINNADYGIAPEDKIYARINTLEDGKTNFTMWIMNDEVIYGGIDFNAAATLLYQAGNEGGAVGYLGNLLGTLVGAGDPGDSGTDEETVVSVAGAMAAIAAERGVDPELYYKKLTEVFNAKYGSMVDFLETEFSGAAESVALSTFRQPISQSVARGLNVGSILLDLGLTIATLGGGTAIGSAIRGGAAGVKGAVAATRVGSKVLTGAKGVLSRLPGWSKLAGSARATYLGKSIKAGETINYVTKTGKNVGKVNPTKVLELTENGVKLQQTVGKNAITFTASHSDFVLGLDPGLANKVLDAANLSATQTALALAGKKASEIADFSRDEIGQGDAPWLGTAAEFMGWYDTLKADPSSYIESLQDQDAATLAEEILNLKKGTGIFGNTTDKEELAMALIITSLTPDSAKKVAAEYNKIDPSMSVYAVIEDELGGDLGMFAKAYWSACTGEGAYVGPVSNIVSKIKS
jgi:hypothetical protein